VITFEALHEHLVKRFDLGEDLVVMSFDEIEDLVGPVPAGAAHKKAWWHGATTRQALAWTLAGWDVDTVGFAARRVAFRRRPA